MHESNDISELKEINRQLQKDISERDLLQKKLRSSEAKVRAIFEAMTDIVLIVHVDKSVLTNVEIIPTNYSNTSNNNIDIIGETVEQLFQDQTRLSWLEKINEALKSAQTINYDYSLLIEDTKYWFSASISLISDTQAVWVARDISDRKRVEEALKLTQARLFLSEKMASLGSLVAGVAHEINNPTSFISGNIDVATVYVKDLLDLITLYQKHYPKSATEIERQINTIDLDFIIEDFPNLLSSMNQGADRIARIVQSLRDFSNLDRANYKLVDIHAGIDNTILLLQHRIDRSPHRKQIQVIKEYTQLPKIECYPQKLNQVFMNVISNAIDALEEGIEKNYICQPQIRIVTELIDDKAAIRIADNGIGITKEVSERLFDPFFTTKIVGKGTGMGLAVSYQVIVDNHKGELYCISESGKGAEFIISIPLRQTV